MIETLSALLLAHVLADFVLQTNAMARNKAQPGVLLLHGALVLVTMQATLGQVSRWELLAMAAAHIAIDLAKIHGPLRGIAGFLTDQMAHATTLVALALLAPDLWTTGAWADHTIAPAIMVLLAGAILATRAGDLAITELMRPYTQRIRNQGLRHGGRTIGWLERGLIFVLMIVGLPIGVGFLIAAKSILRFGTASKDQRTAEYVIIGTLASFAWALAATLLTLALLPEAIRQMLSGLI